MIRVDDCQRRVAPLLRILVGSTLVASSFFHLSSPFDFVGKIHGYGLTSPRMSAALAVVLPVAQLVIGLGLSFEWIYRGAAMAASFLFLVFAFAQSTAFFAGRRISCGCLGELSLDVSVGTILGTVLLAIGSLVAIQPKLPVRERVTL